MMPDTGCEVRARAITATRLARNASHVAVAGVFVLIVRDRARESFATRVRYCFMANRPARTDLAVMHAARPSDHVSVRYLRSDITARARG